MISMRAVAAAHATPERKEKSVSILNRPCLHAFGNGETTTKQTEYSAHYEVPHSLLPEQVLTDP
jgi:hypothetical protein